MFLSLFQTNDLLVDDVAGGGEEVGLEVLREEGEAGGLVHLLVGGDLQVRGQARTQAVL